MNKNIITKEIEFAGKKLVLETGKLATMTNMTVTARYGDTVVLLTVVAGLYNPETDFFPLTINYQEKFYASGLVKSSKFQKRDGRATDEAIIAGRIIDHAIRPLFPNDFYNEVQIVATVLALDPESDPKFLSAVAASAALQASDLPFAGIMTTVKVGYTEQGYTLCPGIAELESESDLDMMVSFVGKDKKFLALEAEANILPEAKILGAIEFAREKVDPLYKFIEDFAKEVNPENKKFVYESKKIAEDLLTDVSKVAKEKIDTLMNKGLDKDILGEEFTLLTNTVFEKLEGKYKKIDMVEALNYLKKNTLGNMILKTKTRPDGRGIKEIRPLSCEVNVLPRVHGSALFSRGITQVLTVATLASPSQELLIQDMYGERSKKFLHYYNFPPYANGETGKLGFPKNREIGHGMIAENALRPVIPNQNLFPYTILLVSETMSSSGSTSMASTCGSTLALMDAGVPITEMVAGIGVGLIADEEFENYMIVTDLAYMEDAFGLMDFKMTGSRNGVTAIQCDMKVQGIPFDILPKIIEQSKEARMQVLDVMEKLISKPRENVSEFAPKSVSFKIEVDKIGSVIGSGGKTIKEIQEKTGSEVNIQEDGTVVVSSINLENAKKAEQIIKDLVREIKQGEIFDGVVEDIVDFGAFVELVPGKSGLLHISEISHDYVDDIYTVIKKGDIVKVKVLEVSRDGKISLSKKILEPGGSDDTRAPRESRENRDSRPFRGPRDNKGPRRDNKGFQKRGH